MLTPREFPSIANFRSTAPSARCVQSHPRSKGDVSPFFNGTIAYDDPVKCGRPDRVARDARGRSLIPITFMRYAPADGRKGFGRRRAQSVGSLHRNDRQTHSSPNAIESLGDLHRRNRSNHRRDDFAQGRARDIFVLADSNKNCRKIGNYLRDAASRSLSTNSKACFKRPKRWTSSTCCGRFRI
jgi:hypothetical protein